jgi:nicotinamide phosphoribosyltransferase
MKLENNIILNLDSYKTSMYNQYPPNTTGVYSYIESRGGAWEKSLFFGLQIFIKDYLTKPITKEDINIADEILTAHGVPFYRAGWEYILEKHNGYLPLRIRAVPEGTIVPTSNVLVTVEATDINCFWLTTQVETALLRAVWYPTTVATLSRSIKDIILPYLNLTGDPAGINFKLHDFGARGVSSMESAGIGGAAHLVNFMGTDNITGLLYAREYYDAGVAGFSIPAMEHSTVTSWGRDREIEAYRNMLKNYAKAGTILACVSDSYDVFNAAEKLWGEELRQEVIDSGAVVVIRPDSGDPVEVNIKLIEILGSKFGYTKNSKGYKVLNHVRLIQGDGVNENTIEAILHTFEVNGWSADNIAFGMGGALLQGVVRDTAKFAMKCSSACIDDVWEDVQKDPITDSGKRSKKGRIELWECGGEYQSSIEKPTNWVDRGVEWKPVLETVFENGKLVKEYTFDEIRNRSNG